MFTVSHKSSNRAAKMNQLKKLQIEKLKNEQMNIDIDIGKCPRYQNLWMISCILKYCLGDPMYVEDFDSAAPHSANHLDYYKNSLEEVNSASKYRQNDEEINLE